MTADLFARSATYFLDLQARILTALEDLDGTGRFRHDDWERGADGGEGPVLGGWGRTRVLEDGAVFEKAGVNFSQVNGRFTPDFAKNFPGDGLDFQAAGISLVLHPRNPNIPTVHMNYRRLSRGNTGWFGGGADLTPYVLVEDDARHFHAVHKAACDAHPAVADYATMKSACDTYFRNTHRNEARGIGGLFFDHMAHSDEEAAFAFVQQAGDAFLDAYLPIAARHKDSPYDTALRDWQLVRRGRYVEFNLVHDRGTLFGLRTGGRIESILMSLPNLVAWRYDHHPEPGSAQAALLDVLRTPREWV